MNQIKSINISSRDDVDSRPLTAEERMPQVKEMLLDLAGHIGPQEKNSFFAAAPAEFAPAEVVRQMARIIRFAQTGEY